MNTFHCYHLKVDSECDNLNKLVMVLVLVKLRPYRFITRDIVLEASVQIHVYIYIFVFNKAICFLIQ